MTLKKKTKGKLLYSERRITVYDVPLDPAAVILRTEGVVLQFPSQTVDIGALCYLSRSNAARVGTNDGRVHPRLVDQTTYSHARAHEIMQAIRYISSMVTDGGYRLNSACNFALVAIQFMDWADNNYHPSALNGGAPSYEAFKSYVAHLRERSNRGEISIPTASQGQWTVHKFLAGVTGLNDLHRGVHTLCATGIPWGSTEPPPENDVAKVESLCLALFQGFSDLVLEQKSYPIKLDMPKYLRWGEPFLWAFPVRRWCLPPHQWQTRDALDLPYWAYDYEKGKLLTADEIREHYRDMYTARWIVANAKNALQDANTDMRHSHRIKSAMTAHAAFVMLFLGQTGMNLAVACSLTWGENYVIGTAQQGFREVKWRAGGKVCAVVLRLNFLPLFKRFIELRAYLLDGRQCESLFLTLGTHRKSMPGPMHPKATNNIYETLKLIDPTMVAVRSRKLRAAKQDFHIRQSEPLIAAQLMGHTEETAIKLYSAGSKNTHYNEVSSFLEQVHDAATRHSTVVKAGETIPEETVGPVGTCVQFDVPRSISNLAPIEPDCKKLEGCFFCDKHRIHPDERDIRKLASCSYVLQQTIYLPEAAAYFMPVLARIDCLMDEVSSVSGMAETVARITREVHDAGELDAYWAAKLALIDDLEIAL